MLGRNRIESRRLGIRISLLEGSYGWNEYRPNMPNFCLLLHSGRAIKPAIALSTLTDSREAFALESMSKVIWATA